MNWWAIAAAFLLALGAILDWRLCKATGNPAPYWAAHLLWPLFPLLAMACLLLTRKRLRG